MYLLYGFVFSLGLVAALPYYAVRFRRYMPTIRDRVGYLNVPPLDNPIWIHAVSVGEVLAIQRLIERLVQERPDTPVVVSTGTPAGQQLARKLRDVAATFYFPLDWISAVSLALDRVRPRIVIIAETEIWPNFLRACRQRSIPVVLINGRISDRSFGRYRWISRWLRRILGDYRLIGMQSDLDRRRIEALGADPKKVVVFGNLKFDLTSEPDSLDPALSEYLEGMRPVLFAASTTGGEEPLVLQALREIRKEFPALRLVLAPRHPERFDEVESLLKSTEWSYSRRTSLGPGTDILLLDTIGELAAAFAYADAVVMGGSFAPRGGHNILEPARFHKPIVFGPHMENFREMSAMFLRAKGAVQVRDGSQISRAVLELLNEPEKARELGRNAGFVLATNRGATERALAHVLELIGEPK